MTLSAQTAETGVTSSSGGDASCGFATAVITGAGGGMGTATARTLSDKGWHVLCIDRDAPSLHRIQAELGTRCTVLHLEVQHPELIARTLECLALRPPVQALVNMAGISRGGTLGTMSEEDWALSFAVNVTPAMRLIQALGPLMQARQKGSILNVGSPVGIVGARKPQYAASKAALHGLTMSAARALGSDGIRVNLLLPGPTITGMTADWSDEQRERVAQGTFLKRMCQPEEIGEMVAFLVSDNSRYLTASVIDMTAGSMMGH
jgi:NAD(P)-dependent dehydrogenase (short-subunit alcohol dehydrogenase family)